MPLLCSRFRFDCYVQLRCDSRFCCISDSCSWRPVFDPHSRQLRSPRHRISDLADETKGQRPRGSRRQLSTPRWSSCRRSGGCGRAAWPPPRGDARLTGSFRNFKARREGLVSHRLSPRALHRTLTPGPRTRFRPRPTPSDLRISGPAENPEKPQRGGSPERGNRAEGAPLMRVPGPAPGQSLARRNLVIRTGLVWLVKSEL